jgi:hypothetical protein
MFSLSLGLIASQAYGWSDTHTHISFLLRVNKHPASASSPIPEEAQVVKNMMFVFFSNSIAVSL